MYSDAEIDRAGESYQASVFPSPELGMPFWRYLGTYAARPTHHIHWEERGGSTLARIVVAVRRAAGRLRPR